jgi:putative tryptophan/tyrosine transport system substrate-binding protein
MRRREFITLLGGAAVAWPLAAHAQQQAMPVVGYLYNGTPEQSAHLVAAFRKGLSEAGYVEGRNVAVEYRWALNDQSRLPQLADDLVRRRVSVIATGTATATLAAKAATKTIPIVFNAAVDPVQIGLVASLNRPGGNITGINSMGSELSAKRFRLLHELLPDAARYALLTSVTGPANDSVLPELQTAASAIGRQVEILYAANKEEIDAAFEIIVQKRMDALWIAESPQFLQRRVQLATLTAYHRMPAIYSDRENAVSGGLMSYGASVADQHRQVGSYVSRILKGEKPADLPVMRATKFEFVINLQTAKLLRLAFPPGLLAIADEVIE